jgi:NADPH:quinone reductase-like Zn-dependent oxidoreductase
VPFHQFHCGVCEWCRKGEFALCDEVTMPGIHRPGGYAEYAVVPAGALLPVPEGVSYEDAAAKNSLATAWHALIGRARLAEGEIVLVNAAGSGVGSAAIQIATLRGARVIASAGSRAKLERALAAGAEAAVNYHEEDLAARVHGLTDGRGVDVVLECVGGEILRKSIEALAKNGRLVTVGAHGGEVVPIDVITLFRKQVSLIGSVRSTPDELTQILALLAEGKLHAVIDTVLPLAEAAAGHRLLEDRRQYGKVVLQTANGAHG